MTRRHILSRHETACLRVHRRDRGGPLCRLRDGTVGLSHRHDHLRPLSDVERYTVLSRWPTPAVLVIDMNGTVVKRWEGYKFRRRAGARAAGRLRHRGRTAPAATPGVAGADRARLRRQRRVEVLEERGDQDARGNHDWSARQHHDWQRDDFPAGYYSPEAPPATTAATR